MCESVRAVLRGLEYVSGINSAVMNIVCKSVECEGRGRAMLFTTSRLRIKCCAVLLLFVSLPLSFFLPFFFSLSQLQIRMKWELIPAFGLSFPSYRNSSIHQLHVFLSTLNSVLICLSYLSKVGEKVG